MTIEHGERRLSHMQRSTFNRLEDCDAPRSAEVGYQRLVRSGLRTTTCKQGLTGLQRGR